MLPFQISIPKRASQCSLGGEKFEAGNFYFSLLKEEEEEIQRLDFCPACWHKVQEENKNFVHWKSKVANPTKEPTKDFFLNRDQKVFSLLQKNPQTDEEKAFAFVLALYLARRRLITLRKEIKNEDKSIFNLYEVHDTEELFMVPKIPLSSLNVEALQKQIASQLSSPHV